MESNVFISIKRTSDGDHFPLKSLRLGQELRLKFQFMCGGHLAKKLSQISKIVQNIQIDKIVDRAVRQFIEKHKNSSLDHISFFFLPFLPLFRENLSLENSSISMWPDVFQLAH